MESRKQSSDGEASRDRTPSNPNVFDDEYAVPPSASGSESSVADGLRFPGSEPSTESTSQQPIRRESSEANLAPANARGITQRNSISKPRLSYGQGDDRARSSSQMSHAVATPLTALPQRTISAASSYAPTDRAQSPSMPSQPTYPYGLYQQSTTMARTPSMATESTTRPLSTITSNNYPQRPTHPYGLYAQNGFDEESESSAPAQPSVPIGFPGRGNDFHRRIGPDGEEQDIIGPDGHTEQLPPYSKYPEEGAAKMAVPIPSIPQEPETPSPQEVSPSSTGSDAPITQGAAAETGGNVSEKRWNEKTWRERRKTKVCGGRLPCWMLTFIVVCLIVIMGLIAGLIGGLLSTEHNSHDSDVVTTTLFDASQIAVPTDCPAPPSGEWALSLGSPEGQQSGCLTEPSQYSAWTCSVNGPPLKLKMSATPAGSQNAGTAWIGDISPNDGAFEYGTQPPVMDVSKMQWVVDLDNPELGPALHFQAYYDKQVIVHEDDLSPPSKRLRRASGSNQGGFSSFTTDWSRRGRVDTGDKPWLCFWNSTFIEGFVYMTQDSQDAASQSSAFASKTSTSTDYRPPWMTSGGSAPTSIPNNDTAAYASSEYAASHAYRRRNDGDGDDDDMPTSPMTTGSTTTTPTPSSTADGSVYTVVASGSGTSTTYTVPTVLPLFPYIVKIEERRMTMSDNNGYCTKMQLLADNELVPAEMPGGGQLSFQLSEADPSSKDLDESKHAGSSKHRRSQVVKRYRRMWDHSVFEREVLIPRDEPEDSCHCQWFNS